MSDGRSEGSRASRILRWPIAVALKLVRVLPEALQRFYADRCTQQSAGIAYRVLFSIAPLAIVLVSIFGLVLQNDSVRDDVVNTIVDWLPVSRRGHERRRGRDHVDRNTRERRRADQPRPLRVGRLGDDDRDPAGARGRDARDRVAPDGARQARRSSPDHERRGSRARHGRPHLARQDSSELLGSVARRNAGLLRGDARRLCSCTQARSVCRSPSCCSCTGSSAHAACSIRDGLAGAIVTGLLLHLIALASAWTYERATRLTVVYGSLTAALVFLYSIYLYSAALLLGAEVAACWAQPPPTERAPRRCSSRHGRAHLARQVPAELCREASPMRQVFRGDARGAAFARGGVRPLPSSSCCSSTDSSRPAG